MCNYILSGNSFGQDVHSWGYEYDVHLNEFEDIARINKDSRILDVAAGTGLIGQKVQKYTTGLLCTKVLFKC